ncbi:Renin, related [Neospora caninum Liverpool]|uniref:Renin, related n=1 Tax=Neospora caninum (strain Liverpool) TaxID=572307 RepID=F0VFK9_NEOCL|nr:Renin, related [Neospora caninum Liverpool]CBZ52503.1 Renin, related [Neospora caninum Liverpool]|eukprot:XP_003882535.1 Renin, related [Neospora caninum Liverpool]
MDTRIMSPSSRFRNLVNTQASSHEVGKRSSLYASLLDSPPVSFLPGGSAVAERDVEDESWQDPAGSFSRGAKTIDRACAFTRLREFTSLRDPLGFFNHAKKRHGQGKAGGRLPSVLCITALCRERFLLFFCSTPGVVKSRPVYSSQLFAGWSCWLFTGKWKCAVLRCPFRSGVMVMPLRKMKSLRQIGWERNSITVPDLQAHLVASLRQQEGLSKRDGNFSGPSDGDDISIHDYMNAQYYTEIYVGSPGQKVRVVVDTGSSDLWVCSASCGMLCMLHKTYNHGKSETYQEDGTPYHVEYASGPVGGFLSVDDVALASLRAAKFLLAEAVDLKGLGTAFFFGKFDGILGMGFPALATNGLKPFMQVAVEQNVVKNWIFAFYLGSANGVDGELAIGGVDEERFIGDINFSKVVDSRYWMIDTKGLKSNGDLVAPTTKMIIDSGTSLIAGPLDEVKRIANMMGAFAVPLMPEGTFFISCDKEKVLRDLQLEVEGQDYPIKIKDLLIPVSTAPGAPCLFGMMGLKALEGDASTPKGVKGFPTPRLLASEKGPIGRTWILGDLFMRNVYTVFDYDNKQIGFARLRN